MELHGPEPTGGVLIGIGDHYEAVPELDWGGREAATRGVPVRLVRAYHLSDASSPWGDGEEPSPVASLRADALRRAQQALTHVRHQWPHLTVRADVVEGVPWDVLVKASASADVTVLGSRQLGPIVGVLLGSVSSVVAAAAHGPVVVVCNPARVPVERPSVVLGLDGSAVTSDVLAFGFDFAARHRIPLRAVLCREPEGTHENAAHARARTAAAEAWLAETVGPWQDKFPDVELRRSVLVDHPVAGLVDASVAQELLVVGSHSAPHPRIAALLGSVTQGVLHHAGCPVAVVHHHRPVPGGVERATPPRP